MNTNTTKFNDKMKAYLVPIIQDHAEGYTKEDAEKAKASPFSWAIAAAKSEIPHEFERRGEHEGLKQWLLGCALNVAIYYDEIFKKLEELHGKKFTGRKLEILAENWFDILSCNMRSFARKENKTANVSNG